MQRCSGDACQRMRLLLARGGLSCQAQSPQCGEKPHGGWSERVQQKDVKLKRKAATATAAVQLRGERAASAKLGQQKNPHMHTLTYTPAHKRTRWFCWRVLGNCRTRGEGGGGSATNVVGWGVSPLHGTPVHCQMTLAWCSIRVLCISHCELCCGTYFPLAAEFLLRSYARYLREALHEPCSHVRKTDRHMISLGSIFQKSCRIGIGPSRALINRVCFEGVRSF